MGKQPSKTGILYVVATPIGNLEDMTERARRTLSEVDVIAAEDTRVSRKLADRYAIKSRMVAYHDHNERQQAAGLVKRLQAGADVALICDAGTPLISDAGYRLVRLAQDNAIRVVTVPGPCAAIAALSVAGLPTDRFVFEGFLPARTPARRQRLAALRDESRTIVLYESAHRVMRLLEDLVAVFGAAREGVIARELTKRFETVRRGWLGSLRDWLADDPMQQKGEFVLLIHGAGASTTVDAADRRILEILLTELPVKQAAELTARITKKSKNDMYRLGLAVKGDR